jgi:acylphosphatase
LHVGGWVRNCADGSVEAHIEGSRVEIEEMMKRMRQGPPTARVDDLQAQNAAPEDILEFEVRN